MSPVRAPRLAGPLLACLLFLGATNHYANPVDNRREYVEGVNDSFSYLAMADAAPHLPVDRLPFHHAQRLVIPYLVGLIHDATGLSIHGLFFATVCVLSI